MLLFSDDERLAARLRRLGKTAEHIAGEMGVHRTTVWRYLRRFDSKLSELRRLTKSALDGEVLDDVLRDESPRG